MARLKGRGDKCVCVQGVRDIKKFYTPKTERGDMFHIVAAHFGQRTWKHKSFPLCLLWDCKIHHVQTEQHIYTHTDLGHLIISLYTKLTTVLSGQTLFI